MTRISVVGTGYVGTVTAVCMALIGHDVVGVDVAESRVHELAAGHVPFYEPGLDELLATTLATGRLSFTSDPRTGLEQAEVVFLCVGTPTGVGGQPDLSQVDSAVRAMAPHFADDAILASKSTVPVGSANWLRSLVEDVRPHDAPPVALVSNPEFLREGSAIEDFLHPDRVVVGGEPRARDVVAGLYARVLDQSFPRGRRGVRPRLLLTDLPSAELTKYAANAFLAMKISFANEMAALCTLVGADVNEVMAALGADHRIGGDFLEAGLGWGGSCFGKDLAALTALAGEYGERTPLLRATVEVNEAARGSAVRRLRAELKVLRGRRIAVLGLAFKPGTDDLRDSPALDVVRDLVKAGCSVSVHDPVVKDLPADLDGVRVAPDAYDAARRSAAVVIATGWPEHAALDLEALADVMHGTVVLDGRNCLDPVLAHDAGLRLLQIGR